MKAKIVVGAALIALGLGVGVAAKAGANLNSVGPNPNPYSGLHQISRDTAPPSPDQIDRGIREGLTVSVPGLPK